MPVFLLESPALRPIEQTRTLQDIVQSFQLTLNVVIWVQFELTSFVPDSATELASANSKLPVRPPGAFGRRKELTATDGHVLLLEYLEEHPLLHFYPGTGPVPSNLDT